MILLNVFHRLIDHLLNMIWLLPDLLSSRGSGVLLQENVSTDLALVIFLSLCLADSDTDLFLLSSILAESRHSRVLADSASS